MNEVVLDSSALLALILHEPGGDLDELLDHAVISAVNLVEVRTKLIDLETFDSTSLDEELRDLIRVEPFTETQAVIVASLRSATKHVGLSLGDWACLALAISNQLDVYTSDARWSEVNVSCTVHQIR